MGIAWSSDEHQGVRPTMRCPSSKSRSVREMAGLNETIRGSPGMVAGGSDSLWHPTSSAAAVIHAVIGRDAGVDRCINSIVQCRDNPSGKGACQ